MSSNTTNPNRNRELVSSSSRSRSTTSASASASASALQQASQSTRQLRLWFKHSLVLGGRQQSNVFFDKNKTIRTPTHTARRHHHHHEQQSQQQSYSTPLSARSLSLSNHSHGHGHTNNNNNIAITVNQISSNVQVETVDDALAVLGGYRSEFPVQKQPQQPLPPHTQIMVNDDNDNDNDNNDNNHYDWILDGHPEWQQQMERTQELMQQLLFDTTTTSLNSIVWGWGGDDTTTTSSHGDGSSSSSALLQTEELLLTLGLGSRMGEQEYQFAAFEEDEPTTPVPVPVPVNEESSSLQFDAAAAAADDDGKAAITAVSDRKEPASFDSNDGGQEDGDDDVHAAAEEDDDDDDDFGDFQEASAIALESSSPSPSPSSSLPSSPPRDGDVAGSTKNKEKAQHAHIDDDDDDDPESTMSPLRDATAPAVVVAATTAATLAPSTNADDVSAAATTTKTTMEGKQSTPSSPPSNNEDFCSFGNFQGATTTTTSTTTTTNENNNNMTLSSSSPLSSPLSSSPPMDDNAVPRTMTMERTPPMLLSKINNATSAVPEVPPSSTAGAILLPSTTTTPTSSSSSSMDRTPLPSFLDAASTSSSSSRTEAATATGAVVNGVVEATLMDRTPLPSFDTVAPTESSLLEEESTTTTDVPTATASSRRSIMGRTPLPSNDQEEEEEPLNLENVHSLLDVSTLEEEQQQDDDDASPKSPSSPPDQTSGPLQHEALLQEDCTPQPSIYNFTTPLKKKQHEAVEPITPITNNYSQVKQEHQQRRGRRLQHRESSSNSSSSNSSPNEPRPAPKRFFQNPSDDDGDDVDEKKEDCHLARSPDEAEGTSAANDLENDGSATTSNRTGPSHEQSSSGGVPSVVQLQFTTKLPTDQASIVVPSTVRLMPNSLENATPSHPKDSPFTATPLSAVATPSPHHHYNQSLARPLRLSLQLDRQSSIASQAASSLASPEGRFLRRTSQMRHLLQGLEDADGNSLEFQEESDDEDSEFDTASLGSLRTLLPDGALWKSSQATPSEEVLTQMISDLLSGLEWDWIPYWKLDHLLAEECDASFVPLWLDQITQQLSDLDSAHLKISKRLYKLIQPHASDLEFANRTALDLSKNLQLCQMYLARSQQSIKLAKYGTSDKTEIGVAMDGVEGAHQLLQWWDAKESYSDLQGIIDGVSSLYKSEQDILQRIEQYDIRSEQSLEQCHDILNMSQHLEQRLCIGTMARLDCLQDLRDRVGQLRSKTLVSRLHSWLETTTVRCCHSVGFDPQHYQRLVQAILLAELPDSPENISKSFCTSVHTALLLEAQKSFGMALLNPTDSENEESDYDQELLALSTNAYLDPSKMGIWTHNLVTIRFDFELSKNHLPSIYHKLCSLLTSRLHAHHCLLRWHKQNIDAWQPESERVIMASIYEELLGRRASLWNICIKVLEECLQEYLNFAPKKKLFQQTDDGKYDDSIWLEDLIGLEDVLGLTNQFLSLRREFLDGVLEQFVNDGGMLREKLFAAQKKHLRAFHIEAMNTTGLSLYREDWSPVTLPTIDPSDGDGVVESIQKAISKAISTENSATLSDKVRSKLNHFQSGEHFQYLDSFLSTGNPFDGVREAPSSLASSPGESIDISVGHSKISSLVKSYVGAQSLQKPLLPKCFANGLFPWISRLLVLLTKLPDITDDILEVFSSISDLYLTTAFRICSGSSKQERLLLGIDSPTPTISLEALAASASSQGSSTSNMFGFGRRSPSHSKSLSAGGGTSSMTMATLPIHTDAEICSPLPTEFDSVEPVRALVLQAQEKLKKVAKLDLVDGWVPDANPANSKNLAELAVATARVLEKRQAALWGCTFLSLTLELCLGAAKRQQLKVDNLVEYVGRLVACMPKLIEIASRASCVRAVRGRIIVQQILMVGSGWEESKLHEHPNAYVDSLCDFTALLWCSLCNAKKIPSGVIHHVIWTHVVESCFASLLDGFSRVPVCSTEGRALMSMDLASLASGMRGRGVQERLEGHASAPTPPAVTTDRGTMAYVDPYIKIFYFPAMDALGWIEENFSRYQLNHMVALIVGSAAAASSEYDTIVKLVNQVKALYSTTRAKIASV